MLAILLMAVGMLVPVLVFQLLTRRWGSMDKIESSPLPYRFWIKWNTPTPEELAMPEKRKSHDHDYVSQAEINQDIPATRRMTLPPLKKNEKSVSLRDLLENKNKDE